MPESPLRLASVDIGAESGRVLVGTFDGSSLSLTDIHRFANAPVTLGDTLHWDFLRLFGEVSAGIRRAGMDGPITSVGIDTWGVDFGLLDSRGRLLANPVHYRDLRTQGMVSAACAVVPREEIYASTGIQLIAINTLYQLLSMVRTNDPVLRLAGRLLLMPDLFGYFLSGLPVAEHTNASTTQCLDPGTRDWARPLLDRLGIPTAMLPEIVESGTLLGPLRGDLAGSTGLGGTRVVLPGTHDTASAVVGAPIASSSMAFLSSGTWSLIGLELPAPVITDASLAANLTNESGVAGTTLLIRNVVGLWLIQESRRALWPAGDGPSYEKIAAMAESAPPFTAFIDPDDERFLRPGDIPARVRDFCAETGQMVPDDVPTVIRVVLESLALRYASAIDQLSAAAARPITSVQVVGGGSNHQLLCQLTACATGLPVRAGPVEATALGNLAVQAIAVGELASIAEARELISRSYSIATYDPSGDWVEARSRFADIARRHLASPAAT